MEHMHWEGHLGSRDVVQVHPNTAAYVRVMDSSNYASYQGGQPYHFYGGQARMNPCAVPVPHSGYWHVAVDLNGGSGSLSARVSTLRR